MSNKGWCQGCGEVFESFWELLRHEKECDGA